MVAFASCALYALNALMFLSANNPVVATPVPQTAETAKSAWWLANIARNGAPAFGTDQGYKVFRNVMDYGAKGDGITDDAAAINRAISEAIPGQERCGLGCDSRTTQPAIIYFPSGTYLVSKSLKQHYYTQMIGEITSLPVLKATPDFNDMAIIDADPYEPDGANWFTNQNNFFRQVRNFVIDTTAQPPNIGAGIHWQVAQATSLQNIRFEMVKGGDNNAQKGIFMDNGSGGFMTDLTFNGGAYGAFLGSQQFTVRNATFNDCKTAIFMNWNWLWSFHGLTINGADIGIDMANGSPSLTGSGVNQTVGSVLVLDSTINAKIGVNSSFSEDSAPTTGGTLILNNVDMTNTPIAVQGASQEQVLAGSAKIDSWAQGQQYVDMSPGNRIQDTTPAPSKPAELLKDGKIFTRSKPQYETVPVDKFVSIKTVAKGDGKSDDTQAIQKALNDLADDQILYVDHGAYLISDTITIPSNKATRIVGELWPMLLVTGEKFADASKLVPAIKVGANAGDSGSLEMSDMIIGTQGPAPGATLMQWNLASEQGASGLWDVHWRVGGYAGSNLQLDKCLKSNTTAWTADSVRPDCQGAGLLFHGAKGAANYYLENTWFWVSDHELDSAPFSQIDIFNGRGVLIESEGASWWWGTASEHNVLYNYQLSAAKNVFMSAIQTETPYFQGNPDATVPFAVQSAINDPDFATSCKDDTPGCKKAWGLRVRDSSDVLLFGGGLYSFFENYGQTCVPGNDCQLNMVSLEGTQSNVHLFGLSTKASVNMVTVDGVGAALDKDNRSNFCATLARFSASTK
ncbi:glucan 1,3-beta-glucosidase [Pseudovirgaria hyperparasitica]|uniref:Glucan 1,3-beta-glucosidase n=1 Tax=Pseudovirgaria hyperparasitica TaxID=470096 RepID=A0A6A6W2S4_9PEZI|nr:glucan 1,3-beta-glucosidase [Pseudovirgaria hyperparasitica]KAF2756893.1 glucan 1,3-beta-glucosidase [Pseudovirgaria hyperparasitica]